MSFFSESDVFAVWAVLELMGHRRLAGRVTEQEIAGKGFLRLDVPGEAEEGTSYADPLGPIVATQFYAPAAVYCITPTTEELARAFAKDNAPEPVTRWELNRGKPEEERW